MIKQIIPDGICLECRGCCRFTQLDSVWSPSLLDSEIEELSSNNIPPALISAQKRVRLLPDDKSNGFLCTFLRVEDNKCSIYAQRPLECQLYPLLINRRDGHIFLALDLNCPYTEENYQQAAFKKYIQDIAGFFHSPEGLMILKNNPQLIKEYPEASNLTELII